MNETTAVRIQKYLADRGVCSRRQAEVLIQEGHVRVNGKPAEIGQKVNPGEDFIKVGSKKVPPQLAERVTLIMNKPKGLLCSNGDPYHDRTIFDTLPREYQKLRLFCAGRLDKDSEGLIVLTNDGALSNQITHPSNQVVKRYHVKVHKPFDPAKIPLLLKGVQSEGEHLYAKKVIMATKGVDKEKRMEIHLEQGRKREIRRLLESFGYYVKRLQRFQIGRLVLKQLAVGAVRPLKNEELDSLFKN